MGFGLSDKKDGGPVTRRSTNTHERGLSRGAENAHDMAAGFCGTPVTALPHAPFCHTVTGSFFGSCFWLCWLP